MQSECLLPQALVHSLGCHGPDAATAFLISLLSSAQSSSAQRRLKQEAVYLSSALYLHSGSSQICLARPAPKKQVCRGKKRDRKRLQKDKSIEKHPVSALHYPTVTPHTVLVFIIFCPVTQHAFHHCFLRWEL